jgi:cysteine-rich repeat protein
MSARTRAFWLAPAVALGLAATAPHRAAAVCGDGILEESEQCDDGNTSFYDGCNNYCQVRLCVEPAPTDCVIARKATLKMRERGEGDQRTGSVKITLSDFAEDVALPDFGDPVFDHTRFDVCVYGQYPHPFASLIVARAFQQCPPKLKACWSLLGEDGYRFTDPGWLSNGVQTMDVVAGPAGKGRIKVAAKRTKKKPWMPLTTERLAEQTSAKIRVMTSDGRCFGADLPEILSNGPDTFRARTAE